MFRRIGVAVLVFAGALAGVAAEPAAAHIIICTNNSFTPSRGTVVGQDAVIGSGHIGCDHAPEMLSIQVCLMFNPKFNDPGHPAWVIIGSSCVRNETALEGRSTISALAAALCAKNGYYRTFSRGEAVHDNTATDEDISLGRLVDNCKNTLPVDPTCCVLSAPGGSMSIGPESEVLLGSDGATADPLPAGELELLPDTAHNWPSPIRVVEGSEWRLPPTEQE